MKVYELLELELGTRAALALCSPWEVLECVTLRSTRAERR